MQTSPYTPEIRLIRLPEVLNLTGLSRSAVYQRMAQDRFPRAVQLTWRAIVWRLGEVKAWIESRPRTASHRA